MSTSTATTHPLDAEQLTDDNVGDHIQFTQHNRLTRTLEPATDVEVSGQLNRVRKFQGANRLLVTVDGVEYGIHNYATVNVGRAAGKSALPSRTVRVRRPATLTEPRERIASIKTMTVATLFASDIDEDCVGHPVEFSLAGVTVFGTLDSIRQGILGDMVSLVVDDHDFIVPADKPVLVGAPSIPPEPDAA